MYYTKTYNMKHLFSLVFVLICVSCYAQEPAYTPMRLNYQFRGIKVDSLFLVPSYTDTTQANTYTAKNIPGCLIRTGSDFWMRNGTATAWLQNVNTGAGSTFTLDLQEVTDNGDTTDNVVTFYDPGVFEGSVRVGVADNLSSSSLVGVYGDPIDASPHSIELYTLKGYSENFFSMKSGGSEFNITNYTSNQISSVGALTISASVLNVVSTDDITLDADSSLYIFADQNITIDSAQDISIQANDDITIDADDVFNIEAGDLYIKATTLEIDKTGSTPTLIGPASTPSDRGYILQNRADSIDLDASTFSATVPGIYRVYNGNTYDFIFPDATTWIGQMVVIINQSGLAIDITGSQNIYDRGKTTQLTQIDVDKMGTFFSDGVNWYGYEL